jgi:ketosteroid isomerase-like protein
MSSTSALPPWLARAITALQTGGIDAYSDMYAPDAVHEFPFEPPGAVPRLVGRETIAAYMRQLPEHIRFGSLSDVRARESGEELIIEATGHHRRVSDDAPMDLCYVWFITRKHGPVTHFRGSMNPLQLAAG